MKVIDLLNKIANEEEVPNKIKFCNHIFEKGYNNRYDSEEDNLLEFICFDFSNINKEIEIIEEQKEIKLPDKLESFEWNSQVGLTNKSAIQYFNKINEIIDYLKRINL